MGKISSFDVFDTILTRRVGQPEALFLFVGNEAIRRGLISCSATRFAMARIDAERQARNQLRFNAPNEEIEFQEIYQVLAVGLLLDKSTTDCLMEIELEIENEFLQRVPGSEAWLSNARRSGGRVIFVSDMYLPKKFVREQLELHGILEESDSLYVSSEHKRCKSTGKLYEVVCQQENAQPSDISHFGNALHPDVLSAQRMGIHAKHFNDGNLNRYEKILESYSSATDGLSSLLAGASRLGRLSVSVQTKQESSIRDIGACVAGPLLIGYVIWLLRTAIRQDISRLYFISRDGQILLKLARVLAPKLGFSGEVRYLYGGRQAWHLPAITEISEELFAWLFVQDGEKLTPAMVFGRLGIKSSEHSKYWTDLGHTQASLDGQISELMANQIREALAQGQLGKDVLKIASGLRKPTLNYLHQEGFTDNVTWAMVDIGWTGKMQASFGKLLSCMGAQPPKGIYFGLKGRPASPDAGAFQGYFFDFYEEWGLGFDIQLFSEVLETFCSADHGLTVGYSQNGDGRYTPTLLEDRTTELLQWGLPLLHESIIATAEQLYLGSDSAPIDTYILDADLRPATDHVLRAFWNSPECEEAHAWARFPFEEDQAGSNWNSLAKQLGIRHAWGLFRHGKIYDKSVRWLAGSWAITPKYTGKALRFARRLGQRIRGW